MDGCSPRRPLVAVLGPTASGKSGLAETLAQLRGGELINADASAFFRELGVGVTKPGGDCRERVPYHLLDLTDLSTPVTLVDYQGLAAHALADISGRGRLPIMVGGSSLYVRAVLEGYLPPQINVPPELRQRVRDLPLAEAVNQLQSLDLEFWARIDRKNPRRVHRALELVLASGEPVPPASSRPLDGYQVLRLVLWPEAKALERRIRKRTEQMWEGWQEEVLSLEKKALAHWLELRKPIGYGTVAAHLRGELTRGEAIEQVVRATNNLAKKQRTWLQRDTEGSDRHRWVLATDEDWERLPALALAELDSFLARFTDLDRRDTWP